MIFLSQFTSYICKFHIIIHLFMGQGNKRMRVATLNYSGIFVSPFQFYAMDNWQELERIGAMFQQNLRQDYSHIKNQIKAVDPQKAPQDDYYARKRFEWKIDKLDKEIKQPRLSPLYIKGFSVDQLFTFQYAGIKGNFLLDQLGFKREWAENQIEWAKENKEFSKLKFSDFELHCCRRFDFQCYRAFIMYVYNRPENWHFFGKDFNGEETLKFDEIVKGINNLSPNQRTKAIGVYQKFMAGYFKRIDSPSKIQMTVDNFFKKWDLDIINLQEVEIKLRERLHEQDKYFVFAPTDMMESDQSVLLVKKSLPLVPEYFRKYYQMEMEALRHLRDQTDDILDNHETFEKRRKELEDAVKRHFNKATSDRILKKIAFEVKPEQYGKFKKMLRAQIFSELENPMKGQFESWVGRYAANFILYWRNRAEAHNKQKDKQVILQFLAELQQKGLLFWTQAFVMTAFRFSNKELQKHQTNQGSQYVIGSFHLSSKQLKNKIQVQILGIFIFELMAQNYQFIFSGDFNSHIVIPDKQNTEGLFSYVKNFYLKEQNALDEVTNLQQTLSIFPKHHLILTTKKKRTILQVQAKKTNLLAEKSIDQIISSIPIVQDQCYTGDVDGLDSGQNQNKSFIPHMRHPYDHFIVEAILDLSNATLANQ